ncbi:MAG: response regulator [Acetivibrio sp.]
MYKVLLVDDEPEVMMAVIKKMEWETLGFKVIGYAQNGEEALEMAENNTPDVVMTDIKMPFMDGLTLSRKLKETYDGIKIIIFSGFDEFEYAREAIKIEVEEYILKPMKLEELTEIFRRIKNMLDKEREEKNDIEKLKHYYIKSLPLMQDQFYIGLIEGKMDENKIESYKKNYQIKMEGESFVAMVLRICGNSDCEENNSTILDQELRKFSIKNLIDENLQSYNFKSFAYFEQIIYIVTMEEKENIKLFVDKLDKICKMAERMLGINVVAGIGSVCPRMQQLKYSYEGAKNAAFYREEDEISHATYIEELQPFIKRAQTFDEQSIQAILMEIKMGDQKKLTSQIEGFIKQVRESKCSIKQLQVMLMGVVTELYKLGGAYDIDMTEILGDNLDVYQQLSRFDGLEEMQKWLLEVCLMVRKSISKERKNTAQLLIDKAVNYMEENYGDSSLSIEKICGILNVSGAYFSTIFKRETGQTFLNYLTEIRMKKAILLLDGTEEKTYIISEQVGYMEPNYFSYVFKKKYGMAPSKYRRIRLEQSSAEN